MEERRVSVKLKPGSGVLLIDRAAQAAFFISCLWDDEQKIPVMVATPPGLPASLAAAVAENRRDEWHDLPMNLGKIRHQHALGKRKDELQGKMMGIRVEMILPGRVRRIFQMARGKNFSPDG